VVDDGLPGYQVFLVGRILGQPVEQRPVVNEHVFSEPFGFLFRFDDITREVMQLKQIPRGPSQAPGVDAVVRVCQFEAVDEILASEFNQQCGLPMLGSMSERIDRLFQVMAVGENERPEVGSRRRLHFSRIPRLAARRTKRENARIGAVEPKRPITPEELAKRRREYRMLHDSMVKKECYRPWKDLRDGR
jgi:hypothetical protein